MDRDLLPDGAEAERTVTFAVDSATAALSGGAGERRSRRGSGDLTVEVQAGSGYTVGDPGSATRDRYGHRTAAAGEPDGVGGGGGRRGGAVLGRARAATEVFDRHQYRYKTDGGYAAWTDIPNSGQHGTMQGMVRT